MVAGGGTAGHVVPGLAIADALRRRGHGPIHFVGSQRGVEVRLVPAAGFPLTVLPGRGLQRRLTTENLRALGGITVGVGRALLLMRRLRPAVVVSLGGYASVPCATAARLLGVPVVVAEQNAVPGAANRMAARIAEVCAVSFPGTDLPRAVVTGNPVRPEVRRLDPARDRDPAREALGVPDDRLLVLAFGGSLGAGRINDAVLDLRQRWRHRSDVVLRHVTGTRNWPLPPERLPPLPPGGLRYDALPYDDAMERAYAAADVLVARAGATTVSEVAVAGLPAVLVPLPGAPGDHQTSNARALVDAGAAVLVPDAECTAERLDRELGALLADPESRRRMAAAARHVSRPDAADRVADLVEAVARG